MNLRLAMTMPMQKAAKIGEIAWETRACLHNKVDALHDVGQDIEDFRFQIGD
jgi:hypothetical protein